MNLEAKDLRIGNYIAEYECEPYFFAIEQITKYVGSELWVVYRNGSIKVKEPTPIPLTEQWLIDLGAEVKTMDAGNGIGAYHSYSILGFELSHLYINMWGIIGVDCVPIKFVHQLQNLIFTLTNEELTLK